MKYHLRRDTCDFYRHVEAIDRPYTIAKEHERDHGDHYVLMEAIRD